MTSPALTALAGACCCAVAVRGLFLMRSPSRVERRELSAVAGEPETHPGPMRRLLELLGARFGPRLLARMSDRRHTLVGRRLDLAGHPRGMDLERYAELKAASLAVAVILAALFALSGSGLGAVPSLALGWLGLDIWLVRAGRRRQERMERDLPDFIDVLAVTVRAGAGYRAALRRVAESLSGPPAQEITTTFRQMDLGATRRDAFEALRTRNDSRTLDTFVAAQLQAEELGVPLADALASIAADTRRAAAQAARRRAQRTEPQVSLITIFLAVPATLILIAIGLFLAADLHLGRLGGY